MLDFFSSWACTSLSFWPGLDTPGGGLLAIAAPAEGAEAIGSPAVTVFQAAVLGMVQGLTEFLPISSTAHLKVVPVMLGWGDPGVAFTAVIQLGSIGAVLWYFWQDLTQLAKGTMTAIATRDYEAQEFRLSLGILIGSLPIIVLGLCVKFLVAEFYDTVLRSTMAIAIVSIVMALLLGLAERLSHHKRNFEDLTTQDGILMGLAQAMALIPGVSRSGSTLTAGLFLGLDRATAARFSFLLGIPAITIAGLTELPGLVTADLGQGGLLPLVAGVLSAAFFSYVSIAWLLRYLQTQNAWVFVWYRLGFGAFLIAAIAGKALPL